MKIEELLNSILSLSIVKLFFKPFSLIFSFLYVLYTLVILKQTQVMLRSLNGTGYGTILIISLAQFLLAVFLFLFAIFL